MPRRVRSDPVPRHAETRESLGWGGFDLFAVRGERPTAHAPKHLDVDPLASRPAGPELPFDHPALHLEPGESCLDHGNTQSEPVGNIVGTERTVRSRETRD